MISNFENEDVNERADDFLTHQEEIKEIPSLEVRQPGGLGRG